jgi:hypothetical protein
LIDSLSIWEARNSAGAPSRVLFDAICTLCLKQAGKARKKMAASKGEEDPKAKGSLK